MLKIILIVVAIIAVGVIGLLVVASTKPDSFSLSRSIVINAPPEKIYPLLDNFHAWTSWSPWEQLDADMTRAYDGPTSGKGAVYSWDGKKAGAGRMEILEATPSTGLVIQLDFLKPVKARNKTVFTLAPNGAQTTVTWTMSGPSNLMTKVMDTVVGMEKMVGPDFEKGLATLKTRAES